MVALKLSKAKKNHHISNKFFPFWIFFGKITYQTNSLVIIMECPCCGAELEYHDTYFLGRDHSNKLGDIYKCPNHEGFPSEEEAREYEKDALSGDETPAEDWTEITCSSSCHHVSGSFYTDRQDRLHEGYPC